MPLQATSGAASYDAFGGGAAAVPNYIEDVFSTWLYQGTSANQTITNGIDLSTKGGLVWCKGRPNAGYAHRLFDTARGVNNSLTTTSTAAQATQTNSVTAFNTTGFSLGTDGNGEVNFSGSTYVGWTFRKQPKFFDVVTYTGTGSDRQVSHSLNSAPACIIVKRTDAAANWQVWHKDVDAAGFGAMVLNSTAAAPSGNYVFRGASFQTATEFGVRSGATINESGASYVAYLFAHDAGGFGLTSTDNVISCGSFNTGAGDDVTVSLGYEPQWVMVKTTNQAYSWEMYDNMRGMGNTFLSNLNPNLTQADNYQSTSTGLVPNATGFSSKSYWGANTNLIYIAIRRGPMKVPTVGTSVFNPVTYTAAASTSYSTGLSYIDLMIEKRRDSAQDGFFYDRLRGNANRLRPASTSSEVTDANSWSNQFANQGTVTTASSLGSEWQGSQVIWNMRRAPSFMDVVCYTGVGGMGQTLNHNLSVIPNMMIIKCRSAASTDWFVWHDGILTNPTRAYSVLNSTAASAESFTLWGSTIPTKTAFFVAGTAANGTNASGATFVAYLFATCAGVSKVGSYTGTATTKQIDCGFTAGARFVLIKKTSGTGSWYVWDSARGIVSGNDPYLLLNSTAAEVTNTDYIDTYSAGFEISSTAPSEINENGGSFIFFAVS